MKFNHLDIEDFYNIITNNIDSDLNLYNNHLKNCKYCQEALVTLNDLNFMEKLAISKNEYIVSLSLYNLISKIVFINFNRKINYQTKEVQFRGSNERKFVEFTIEEEKYIIFCKYFPENDEKSIKINLKSKINHLKISFIDKNNKKEKILYFEKNPLNNDLSFLIKEKYLILEIDEKITKFV
ncbi:MAG: hypothetical protein N3A58_06020 [Spirochaetes bacterium]|nr:hypothetical protein [Spirochaetota bacterium]